MDLHHVSTRSQLNAFGGTIARVHKQRHRGPHPDDARLFRDDAKLAVLRRAADEVVWLRGRDYPLASAVRMVGDHHQLEARARLVLSRSCCSPAAAEHRRAKELEPHALHGASLSIDGFNLVVTLETALGGGLLLVGRDGCLRDLAGLRGSYHLLDDTTRAIDLVFEAIDTLGAARVEVLLEGAVSNAGRLREAIVTAAGARDVTVTLVRDADPILVDRARVVSADALILDGCASWFNLTRWIVDRAIPDAWRVEV